MKVIAHIHTDYPQKFGVPRQSGLVDSVGQIVFEPEYRNPDAVRGIDGYDYLWLLWQFEGAQQRAWSPTVAQPRLGGNTQMGVFATRSPNRPNPIGLSSVRLLEVKFTTKGPVLVVSGADLRDNTPIYDIKPYLPYTDSHPNARYGFAKAGREHQLQVQFPKELLDCLPKEKQHAAVQMLQQDPRPAYHTGGQRQYGVAFAGVDIHFVVNENTLTVVEVIPLTD